MKNFSHILLFVLSSWLWSCNKNDVITTLPVPEIIVENGGVYTTKVGRSVVLTPRVEGGEGAVFGWYDQGVKVGSGLSYEFVSDVADTFYLTLRVENSSGKDEADFRVEVYELMPPQISFLAKNNTIEIVAGEPTEIVPQVVGGQGAFYRWTLDEEPCGQEPTCVVTLRQIGSHSLRLRVENEDGSAEKEVALEVVERRSGSVVFQPLTASGEEAPVRHISLGQSITLSPTIEGFVSPTYRWSVGEEVVGEEEFLCFTPLAEGDYEIELMVSDEDGYFGRATIVVACCAAEGSFRRTSSAECSHACNKVYEYTPAPGQFIGESKSGFSGLEQSAEAAAAYAEQRLAEGKNISLGAWGGSLVVGFDHSIANDEGADITIYGNMLKTSSEAGIVWVMQDSNGNGVPDDEWYELRGSEWGGESHTTRYAVTYFRAAGRQMPIRWRDNLGAEGEVPYMATHADATYFPQWIEADHYTLYGSRLAQNSSTLSSGVVSHNAYAWGYADNLGSDSEGDEAVTEDTAIGCGFDIANAVAVDGRAVELQYIDFVKVQSAINGYDRAMGELSTEVLGIEERR